MVVATHVVAVIVLVVALVVVLVVGVSLNVRAQLSIYGSLQDIAALVLVKVLDPILATPVVGDDCSVVLTPASALEVHYSTRRHALVVNNLACLAPLLGDAEPHSGTHGNGTVGPSLHLEGEHLVRKDSHGVDKLDVEYLQRQRE